MPESHDELQGLIYLRRTGASHFHGMRSLTSGEYRVVNDAWDRRRGNRRRTHRHGDDRRRSG